MPHTAPFYRIGNTGTRKKGSGTFYQPDGEQPVGKAMARLGGMLLHGG